MKRFTLSTTRPVAGIALVLALAMGVLAASPAASSAAPMVRPQTLAPGAPAPGSTALGAVPATQPITVSVTVAPSNASGLTALLHALYTPNSPQFHHWLAPGQFRNEFGPDPAAIAVASSWFHSVGLTPMVSGYRVSVTAPAAQLGHALGTSFESYALKDGGTGYVASSAPLVPSDLASGQLTAILGLNTTVRFMPQVVHGGTGGPGQAPHAVVPHADGLTPCAGAATVAGSNFYTLDQVGSDYGIGSLLAQGRNGTGQTVGLYELGQTSASDISTYESCFGLSNSVSVQTVDGGASSGAGPTSEADLDAEQVMTQAPGASVISYEGPNTTQGSYDVWNSIVSADAAQVVSTSWGLCEPLAASGGTIGAYTTLFEQASAQGQSVFAASGDSGTEGCYTANLSTGAQVTYPASDSWVTAVGGTQMYNNSPAQQTTWNYCQSGESTACANSYGGTAAGGGGMSRYEPQPSFQPKDWVWTVAQPCGTQCREVPDISANAGLLMVVYTNGSWQPDGGTSFAAPFMGGLLADVGSGCGRFGVLTPALYSLYADGSYGSAFTDVTSGDIDMTGSNSGIYPATSGYDTATGIGSPIAAGLTCASVSSVSPGYSGSEVTVSGLGLEHAVISFGGASATVVSANATSATVVVPAGSGTVTVSANSVLGQGATAQFTYAPPPPPPPPPPQHGYWLVGSDGGIFSFGSAQFYGSMGGIALQRPVVGIVPTRDRGGYWLDASDGGVFSFGDTQFYGSIPGLGLNPAGSGKPNSLNASIVGMVPSHDQGGYFMVASDGGVFAFGDAHFAGSCPGIGGCSGAAVAVMPDSSGNGYWLVTSTGAVYTFGDAPFLGAPGPQSSAITSAVPTPDGGGYYILDAAGQVFTYGDAGQKGSVASGATGGLNPASAVFVTSDNGGYWVSDAIGSVFTFGDAPNDGSMAGTHLNGSIIAASGS